MTGNHAPMAIGLALTLAAAVASPEAAISERARRLHARAIVVDGHADTPQRMVFDGFDLAHRDAEGHVDIPRMREGGLDAVFFSIYVPSASPDRRRSSARSSRSTPSGSRSAAIRATSRWPRRRPRSAARTTRAGSPPSWASRAGT
jgi:membrane dipeptidase